jgi:hypothetical protein
MENFFDYIKKRYSFEEQQDLFLLIYAVGNDKALRILKEEVEGKGKKLFAHYPGIGCELGLSEREEAEGKDEKIIACLPSIDGELDLSKYEIVGDILDGVLLIEK